MSLPIENENNISDAYNLAFVKNHGRYAYLPDWSYLQCNHMTYSFKF